MYAYLPMPMHAHGHGLCSYVRDTSLRPQRIWGSRLGREKQGKQGNVGFFCYARVELMLKPLLLYESPESPPCTEGQSSLVASQSWGSPNCSLG